MKWLPWLVLLWTAVLSFLVRDSLDFRMNYPMTEQGPVKEGWFSVDPDGLYHARRLHRLMEEGAPVAERDSAMNYPEGARIPWPPYYTYALRGLTAPMLGGETESLQVAVERAVSSLPLWFGVLTSMVVALAAYRLGGAFAGLAAGTYHALTYGAAHYAMPGVGDHHAWVSLLAALMLLALSEGILRGALEKSRSAWLWGGIAGALAGLNLGSWVASLLYILEVQLLFACLLFVHARRSKPGLPALGLAFHLTALLVVMPAVFSSPWKEAFPWMVVNLSWFHATELGLGALVFVPLLALHPNPVLVRRYPWIVGAVLAGAGLLLWIADLGPAAGIREGFAWVSRADLFMAGIAESAPLLGSEATIPGGWGRWLGYGLMALMPAWLWVSLQCWKQRKEAVLPWLVATPILLAQALGQARFSDALSGPMALVLALAAAGLFHRLRSWKPDWGNPIPSLAVAALLWIGLIGMQWPAIAYGLDRCQHLEEDRASQSFWKLGAYRLLHEWLAEQDGEGAVLAAWDQGHALEWVAGRPSVATNFGSYVGEAGFLAPARFFTASDPKAAEEVLRRHQIGEVLVHSDLENTFPHLRNQVFSVESGQLEPPRWKASMVRQLMPLTESLRSGEGPQVDFLRLIHVSPFLDTTHRPRLSKDLGPARSLPCGWVWQRVAGARLEAEGSARATLSVDIRLRYPSGREYSYQAESVVGEDGLARLRIPYNTESLNGEAEVISAEWRFQSRRGRLIVREQDVLNGNRIKLD